MPIKDCNGEVIGVAQVSFYWCKKKSTFSILEWRRASAGRKRFYCSNIFSFQVINKKGDTCFTANDEKIFASYLQFCGIGLRNAQLYEKSQLEVKRNQVCKFWPEVVRINKQWKKKKNVASVRRRKLKKKVESFWIFRFTSFSLLPPSHSSFPFFSYCISGLWDFFLD